MTYNKFSEDHEGQSSSRFQEPTVYDFNIGDGPICRANFRELESWYAQSYESYRSTEQENNQMYTDLLKALSESRIELIDN